MPKSHAQRQQAYRDRQRTAGRHQAERISELEAALEARCPDRVPAERWQQAVADGKTFLARWGDQAHALGWTVRDLFGLLIVPEHAKPSFNRLSRYDETGLIWVLGGREVFALTRETAAIHNPSGSITTYRRCAKPALGPAATALTISKHERGDQ